MHCALCTKSGLCRGVPTPNSNASGGRIALYREGLTDLEGIVGKYLAHPVRARDQVVQYPSSGLLAKSRLGRTC